MPIYEFECRKCGAHMEVFQKLNDKPPVKCRKCGGRLERKLSAPAIQFKGSGWYVTDYARKGGESAGKSSGSSESSSGGGDDSSAGPVKKIEPAKSEPKAEPSKSSKSSDD